MNCSWKPVFTLLLSLFFGLSAQAAPQLPESLIGYYKDQNDRLVVLQRDFFYLEDVINKSGYYQEIAPQVDGSYLLYIRQDAQQHRLLELSLRPIDGGLMATLKDYRKEELALKLFQPTEYTQVNDQPFPMPEGRWYCGKDDRVVEITEDAITIEGEIFRLEEGVEVIFNQQLRPYFLLESTNQQQFVARPMALNEHYFAWNVLNRYYEHCRRDIRKPYGKSDFYEDLPVRLIGNWESAGAEKVNISFYPDYTFSLAKEKAKIKRFTNLPTKETIHLEVVLEEDRFLWAIQAISNDELEITDLATKETTKYLRTSDLADFVEGPEVEAEQHPFIFWAMGVAMGLIIAIVVILRTRRRNQKKREFV